MSRQLFDVTLRVDASQMAELVIDWGKHLQGAVPINGEAGQIRTRRQRAQSSGNRGKHSKEGQMLTRTTKKTSPTPESAPEWAAHVANLGYTMGQNFSRRELVKKLEKKFPTLGYAPSGASPAISHAVRLGYLKRIER